ncbi:MAG TPA: hypothetical protein VLB80_02850 [Candidatus Babeliales bacterium]|nr:hypothetical protein [Candidatus Babeliales bacterium]
MNATNYIYPVASLNNGVIILYIYQQSTTCIELFEWNTITNTIEQILWSLFNPAGLQLLPNNVGFSFIDNGRLRVKLFHKRAPKAIDFDEPLFHINSLQWINEHMCYCSAQNNDRFSIFELYDNGVIKCLITEHDKDFMYPQKINTQIFYIERYKKEDSYFYYHIMQMDYPSKKMKMNDTSQATVVASFKNKPIIFLTMESEQKGFVLEHMDTIEDNSDVMLFYYHCIIKKDNVWQTKYLFSFEIPTYLLLHGEQSLYESILPLLPRIINNKIYFVDCSENKNYNLTPYYYDLTTEQRNKVIVPEQKGHYFVPMLCGKKMYCGGTKINSTEPLFICNNFN